MLLRMGHHQLLPQEIATMKPKDLADEIRGAGAGFRFADGPVIIASIGKGKGRSDTSEKVKMQLPDFQIIGMAASCSTCEQVASEFDVDFAAESADCYQSFARLIWPCIDHVEGCPAEPYLPVHEGPKRSFVKVKAEFERLREEGLEKAASVRRVPRKTKAPPKKAKTAGPSSAKKRVTKKAVKKVAKKAAKKKSPRKKRG